jgi:hypothetical protein
MHSLATEVHNGDVPLGLRPWGNSFLWVGLRSLNERKMPMYSSINQQKGVRNMRTVYRRRRIVAAIVASVLSIAVIKATYEASAFVVERITEPTFVCEPGSHTLRQGDKIWNIADVKATSLMLLDKSWTTMELRARTLILCSLEQSSSLMRKETSDE